MKRSLFMAMIFAIIYQGAKADEGMWMPFLLQKNYQDMVKKGLKLSPQQIYDINNNSLKDAIVRIDGGSCTGEMISGEGLMLTNHHCAYDDIQSQSSVEHDYLTNGFWAKNHGDELPIPGKSVSFLVRMEDVTQRVSDSILSNSDPEKRGEMIQKASKAIEEEITKDSVYEASVVSMFEGNEFYLFVYQTYNDVRLVGAPPSSIGNFGGETDNWMWPRHTGDFSIYRIYTGPDGKPADFSKDNIPYKPAHFLPISLKGVQPGDFAMILGYPGSTDRYLPAEGVALTINQINPASVKLKRQKLDILKSAQQSDDKLRIQYASKYQYLSNFWKKDREETKSLKSLGVYDQKKALENDFTAWAAADAVRSEKYGKVIPTFNEVYALKMDSKSSMTRAYTSEVLFDPHLMFLAMRTLNLYMLLKGGQDVKEAAEELKGAADEMFGEFHPETDRRMLAAMLKAMATDLPAQLQAPALAAANKKYKGDFDKYTASLYKSSILADKDDFIKFLDRPSVKTLERDPGFALFYSLYTKVREVRASQSKEDKKLADARRLYIDGLRNMLPDKSFYPDANSTMRLTYGNVMDYSPRDAIQYHFQTYLKGVIEKEDPDNPEFVVPAKLKELYKNNDYGQYVSDGKMPIAFLTNNDITGGNSGSPVINGNGELIGAAFDGNSESMSSDIKFDPTMQRTIICDIRYVLFIIDKFAGAGYLLDEMKLAR